MEAGAGWEPQSTGANLESGKMRPVLGQVESLGMGAGLALRWDGSLDLLEPAWSLRPQGH